MKRIYTAQSLPIVAHYKHMLEYAGIDCLIKNEFLGSGMGELPPIECWPELWVMRDEQAERAQHLLAKATEEPAGGYGRPWRCRECGETVDAIFSMCWNCQAGRPD